MKQIGIPPPIKSPNPEEKSALNLALEIAKKNNSDIVLGIDPDACISKNVKEIF